MRESPIDFPHIWAETMNATKSGVRELLKAAGLPGDIVRWLTIARADPVLPVAFHIGDRAAAAIGAAGLAAAYLAWLRDGTEQDVAVDTGRAAVSLRSATYLRVDGAKPPSPWDPVGGMYEVGAGRWISIHCNFPGHRAAAARALGVPAERPAMERAALEWDGVALEDAIHAAGGCAGFVRTEAEWAAHPQSAAVAGQALLSVERIGDAAPRALRPAAQPLSGMRVLDLTRVLAGPTCGRLLAEYGADVLKVNGAHLPDSGAAEFDTGVGKLSATLDLRDEGDAARLRALVESADVFSQSYRPGTLGARGLSPEALAGARPGIVVTTLTAWGPTGPWARRRGFDSIVQATSGMADIVGGRESPRLMPVSAIDYISGTLMALGTMAALARQVTEGGSFHVRVSLARTGQWLRDAGLIDRVAWAGLPADWTEDEIASVSMEQISPIGRVRHLAPVARLSATPGAWHRPPVPIGTHPAIWPNEGNATR